MTTRDKDSSSPDSKLASAPETGMAHLKQVTLTSDEWDVVHDALLDAEANAQRSADDWQGRTREAGYRQDAVEARRILDKLNTALSAPSSSRAPEPQQTTDFHSRLMLNEYGRVCWDKGYESAKRELAARAPEREPQTLKAILRAKRWLTELERNPMHATLLDCERSEHEQVIRELLAQCSGHSPVEDARCISCGRGEDQGCDLDESSACPRHGIRAPEWTKGCFRAHHSFGVDVDGTWRCNTCGLTDAPTASRAPEREPVKCIIGEYCSRHGFVHGAEAEELRERLDKAAADDTLTAYQVRNILDDVDARDSLAYCEALAAASPAPTEGNE